MIRFWLRQVLIDGILVIACIIIFGLIVNSVTKKARAHDPQTHQADSLADAKSDAYGVCCDGKDWSRVTVWERTDTGFRILVRGVWYTASHRTKVNNMDNPDGEAKVWINGPKEAPYVRCFMPGTLI